MLQDARDGQIDMIISKSLSRFARNTVDTLNIVREFKTLSVDVYFQKEDIHTLDAKGEFLITMMSIFAQEESRSISENVTWGKRKRMAEGRFSLPYKHFLGYDRGKDGTPIVNQTGATVVRYIYWLFLHRKTTYEIAHLLESLDIPAPSGGRRWEPSVVKSILTNEKYVGDALLQKGFTVDYLTKKSKKNEGELPQYYVRDSHKAIIGRIAWDEVQSIITTEKRINTSASPFCNLLFCGECGDRYGAKKWFYRGTYKTVWECNSKYKLKHNSHQHLYEPEPQHAIALAVWKLMERELLEVLPHIGRGVILDDFAAYVTNEVLNGRLLYLIKRCVLFHDFRMAVTYLDGSEISVDVPIMRQRNKLKIPKERYS